MRFSRFARLFPAFSILCLVSSFVYAAPFSLVSGKSSDIILNFTIPAYSIEKVSVNGEVCEMIKTAQAGISLQKGSPELPFYSQNVAIGTSNASVEVVDIQYKEIAVNKIIPSKGSLTRNIDPQSIPFEFGDAYLQNEWFPQQSVGASEPFVLRDLRGITVNVNAFQYNPAAKKLRIIVAMTLKVVLSGTYSGQDYVTSNANSLDANFAAMYGMSFINYSPSTRYTSIFDGDKMIVICPTALMNAIKPFVTWKNQKGIATTVYEFPKDVGGSDAAAIAAFIKTKYTADKISYVLLVGDFEQLPSPIRTYTSSGTTENVPCDPRYTMVNGAATDIVPDIFVGRLSATTEAEVTNQVNKSVNYEQKADPAGTWYGKAIGTGTSEGTPTDYSFIQKYHTQLKAYGFSTCDEIFQGVNAFTKADFSNWANDGRCWINHMGHGSSDGFMFQSQFSFYSADVKALTNGTKLPVVISVACNNGQFNARTCFGENWMRHTSGGAVVFTGSSPLMDWTQPQPSNDEIVRLLCTDTLLSVGAIFFNGQANMIGKIGASSAEKTMSSWNYFGDPSLTIFTKKPTPIVPTSPVDVASNSSFTVDFPENLTGRVCLWSAKTGIVAAKMIYKAKTVTLDVKTIDASDTKLTLTVTSINRAALQKDIPVRGSAIGTSLNNLLIGCNFAQTVNQLNFIYNAASKASITIFNVKGCAVFQGTNLKNWNFTNAQGVSVAKGIYFAQVALTNASGSVEVFKKQISVW